MFRAVLNNNANFYFLTYDRTLATSSSNDNSKYSTDNARCNVTAYLHIRNSFTYLLTYYLDLCYQDHQP